MKESHRVLSWVSSLFILQYIQRFPTVFLPGLPVILEAHRALLVHGYPEEETQTVECGFDRSVFDQQSSRISESIRGSLGFCMRGPSKTSYPEVKAWHKPLHTAPNQFSFFIYTSNRTLTAFKNIKVLTGPPLGPTGPTSPCSPRSPCRQKRRYFKA